MRTPTSLLASRRGERIALRIEGDPVPAIFTVSPVIWLSVRTSDPALAKARVASLTAQVQQLVAAVSQPPARLTHKQKTALLGEIYQRLVDDREDEPGHADAWLRVARGAEMAKESAAEPEEQAWAEAYVGPIVDRFLDEKAVRVDDETRRVLIVGALDRVRDASLLLARRADGDYSPDPLAAQIPAWHLAGASGGKTLTALFDAWKQERTQTGATEATARRYRPIIAAFRAFLGHDDLGRITKADVLGFKDHRLNVEKLSPKTIKDVDLAALKAVFSWGVDNEWMKASPAASVTLRVPKATKRKGHSDAAVRVLLHGALAHKPSNQESRFTSAAKRWAFLLCCFTGARIGEIAQLRKQDIERSSEGIWMIHLRPEAGTIKGGRERSAPVHSQIIALGFIAFVEQAPDGYLFINAPRKDAPLPAIRTCTNRLRDFTGSLLEAAGIEEPNVSPTHGWRHRFITVCRKADVSTELRKMITGHRGDGVDEEHYGEPAGLQREIEKLPWIELPLPYDRRPKPKQTVE